MRRGEQTIVFADRAAAGRRLAAALNGTDEDLTDAVLYALPRGGVPVAAEIAEALELPLDIMLVRKLGAPGQPELAVGAIATGGVMIINDDISASLGITPAIIESIAQRERIEMTRREEAYRPAGAAIDPAGRIAVLVDDGVATGATMEAAIEAMRRLDARRIIVAVPHGSPDTIRRLEARCDRMVCLETPDPYMAVGYWYRAFGQTPDSEVIRLLQTYGAAGDPAATRTARRS